MSLLLRIDVDRPYGKIGLIRHILSRISQDLYFPKINKLGYLKELRLLLELLNRLNIRSYIFFRQITFPTKNILELISKGKHIIGLHLENSRTLETFSRELTKLENHTNQKVFAFSKHGSGRSKYGFFHYHPYEPEKYLLWAQNFNLFLFLGNLENPSLSYKIINEKLYYFPSAFWLEPKYRDTKNFTIDWLFEEIKHRDIVLLIHPDEIMADKKIFDQFQFIILNAEIKIIDTL